MQKSNCRDSIHKRHGSDWLQDALYILSTKKSTDKNTASVIRWRHADACHLYFDSPLSSWLSYLFTWRILYLIDVYSSACLLDLFCLQCIVHVMCLYDVHTSCRADVCTNAFRQDYCAIPFPFDSPYYSDRDRDQCFNCFPIPPDWKDSASRLLTLITWWLDKVV